VGRRLRCFSEAGVVRGGTGRVRCLLLLGRGSMEMPGLSEKGRKVEGKGREKEMG